MATGHFHLTLSFDEKLKTHTDFDKQGRSDVQLFYKFVSGHVVYVDEI